MEEKKISVIVPVFNAGKYLHRCLDSILNNTYRNLEIICVNDGSTDDSLRILREYEKLDPRLRVIEQENLGVSSARNAGLKTFTGDFVSFVDSDDWIHPRFFEVLFRAAEECQAAISACKYVSATKMSEFAELHSKSVTCFSRNDAMKHHVIRKYITARIYRKELLNGIQFINGVQLGEDNIFNIHILCGHPTILIAFTDMDMYYYFSNPQSITHTIPCEKYLDAAEWYINHIPSFIDKQAKLCLLDQACKNIWWCRYVLIFDLNRKIIDMKAKLLLKKCGEYRYLLPMKGKMIFYTFFACPSLYRLYRIMTDPTMLIWEKGQRAKLWELKKREKN